MTNTPITVADDESVKTAVATRLNVSSSDVEAGSMTFRTEEKFGNGARHIGMWQQHLYHEGTGDYLGTAYYDADGNASVELDDES